MSLLIVGSMAFDTIETPFGRREKVIGGSGTYCSLAASFFTKPRIVAVVGRDFPEAAVSFLAKRGIELGGLEIREGKTFHWEGRYGEDPNQRTTVKTELNVFRDFRPAIPESTRRADIVFLANIDPDAHGDILGQVRKPRLAAMDTIKFWIETKRESVLRELGRVDVFFANEEEARMLAGTGNLIAAGRWILERGPRLAVLKKGEHGAIVLSRKFVFGVLAHPCDHVIDPTGAGDSFAGGFLGYLDKVGEYKPSGFKKAAVYGSVLASFAIEDFGIGRFEKLSRQEIEGRYELFKKMMSF